MNKSYIIAAVLTLGITAWVLGGYLLRSPETQTAETPAAAETADPMTVSVRTQNAQSVERHILAQGHAEPNRTVTVRAETAGQIAEIIADEGATVTSGEVIARLKINDRKARLERAKARLREAESAYGAAQSLGEKGYQTQRQSDEAYSALQTARAELEEAQLELQHTDIRAPFEGDLLESKIELGAYVAVNGEIATIVDNDPLVVSVRIPQQDISNVKTGRQASVTFATGEQREGRVRYIAARADENTRTFRVEIDVPNPDRTIPSGISAEAKIPTGSVMAHFVSPAAMSLNDEGVLGVKTVDENNRVVFHAADIVRSDVDGVWLTGLGTRARIITAGAGFVETGEEVRVSEEDDGQQPDADGRATSQLSRGEAEDERRKVRR